ncbi:AAEL000379-PA [Aedes aegypti]|uniref:TIL domain-containing protein n=2 Tax=Aedes aegypti TaxID=7159 RepID=Q17PL4_AEDAE|nr:cysteine-rich venom protein 6 [Aedes aegypti]XP_021711882.1 cysteine-rich venom protein 6-like [Aedes aegypti]EAT48603.1 AAEL000379-PA [Aedes aegypti]
MKLLISLAVIALIYTCVTASNFCSGPNEVYQECGSACEKTCAGLGANQTCNEKCVPGCFCADGFVRLNHSGQCVPSSKCPKVRVRRAPEPLPPLVIPVPIPIPIPVPPIVRPRGPLWWLRPPPPPLFG